MSKFEELYRIDVSDKVEKKGNQNYLSWAYAWAEFMKVYPKATYEVKKFNGLPYVYDEKTGYIVYTSVTVEDTTHEMWLPVMDARNNAKKNADVFDINKTIMRCLTKNLAMFGLGLYIYAGEDYPTVDGETGGEDKKPQGSPQKTAKKPVVERKEAEEFKPLTRSELVQVYGIKNPEKTLAWLEEKFGVPLKEWDKEATDAARKVLDKKLEEVKENAKKLRENDGGEYPFPIN